MKKYLIAFGLLLSATVALAVNLPIAQLPLGSAASTGSTDSFPYANVTAGVPYRLGLPDLVNLPAMQATFAKLTAPTFTAPVDIGTPGFTDTGVMTQFTSSANSYVQSILQNSSSGSGASADFIVSNNLGTATTYYGDFGINSSTFSGTGSLSLPNATYLYAANGDLALGTTTANAVHLSTYGNSSDALTINSSNALIFPALTGPLFGAGTSAVYTGTLSGNTTKLVTTTGSLTLNDCVKIDSNGNFIDAGAACGSGGGGGVSTVGTYNSQTSAANGAVISGSSIYFQPFTSANPGMVPASGGGTTNFLRADGTFAAPSGGGGISALTGDVTASGTGSVAATLAATSNGTLTTLSGLTTASSLASVGTITSGTWHGSLVGSLYGGTGLNTSAATGVPSISSGTWSVNTTLPYNLGGTNAATQAAAQANMSPETTKGDTTIYGTAPARQAVPGDYGALVPDSAQTNGWRSAPYTAVAGQPRKNYIPYPDFENGAATGWTQGTIGTLTNGLPTGTPTFGSGASGTSSITATSGTTLGGSYYLAYANTAATTAGNMIATSAITIDGEDQGKVLSVRFPFSVTSGASNTNFSGTSSNSYAWAVWDVTNSAWLSSSGNFCMAQNVGVGNCTNAMFQTATTTASIRFVLYSANATTGAATLALDDFYVGPAVYANGPQVTDWIAYTATFSGGTATPTTYYRRVGDSLEVNFNVAFTGSASSSFSLTIPSQYAIDTTKLGGTTNQTIGVASAVASGGGTQDTGYVLPNGSTTSVGFSGSGSGNVWGSGIPFSWSSGASLRGIFTVPIVGWSSNTAIGQDAAVGDVSSQYTTLSSTTITSGTALSFTTATYDTTGSLSSGTTYTAPASGKYKIGVGGIYTTSAALNLSVYVNGSSRVSNMITLNSSYRLSANAELKLNAGDTVTLVPSANATAADTNGYFTVEKMGAPQTISPSASEAFSYYGSTQTVTTTPTALINPTKSVDTLAGMNTSTGLYTARNSGTFHCDCAFYANFSSAAAILGQFVVNGSNMGPQITGSNGTGSSMSGGFELPVLAGQTIGCYVSSSTGTSGSQAGALFACHRVGF